MTFNKKPKFVGQFITVLAIAVICVVLSINIANHTDKSSDFYVFWTAGYNFMHGNPLYSRIGGACRFIYPPFAAFLFQFFALFPLKVAAIIFAIINFMLYFLALFLVRKIFGFYIKDSRKLNISLFFAALLSFRYFWYHFHFLQLNIVVFVLCLAGVLLYLNGKRTYPVFFLVFATFIKVFPVFFLVWLVIRGSFKMPFIIAGVVILFTFAPIINRGFSRAESDIKDYYSSFLEPFQKGRVEPEFNNYSLSSAIFNAFQPSIDSDGDNFRLFYISREATNIICKFASILVLSMLIFIVRRNRVLNRGVTVYEMAILFLTALLLSGITWEYHLVTLIFAFMALISMNVAGMKKGWAFFRVVFLLFAIALDLVGRDTVGNKLFHYIGGYNALTILMLGLFLFFFFFDIRQHNKIDIVKSHSL